MDNAFPLYCTVSRLSICEMSPKPKDEKIAKQKICVIPQYINMQKNIIIHFRAPDFPVLVLLLKTKS